MKDSKSTQWANWIGGLLGRRARRLVRRIGTAFLTPLSFALNSGHFQSTFAEKALSRRGKAMPWFTYPAIQRFLKGLVRNNKGAVGMAINPFRPASSFQQRFAYRDVGGKAALGTGHRGSSSSPPLEGRPPGRGGRAASGTSGRDKSRMDSCRASLTLFGE